MTSPRSSDPADAPRAGAATGDAPAAARVSSGASAGSIATSDAATSAAPRELSAATPAPEVIGAQRAEGVAKPPRRRLTLQNYAWIIGAAVVIVAALHWLGPVLTPFLIGAILAYLGTPLVDRAAARGVPRALATLFVVLAFGLVLCALFLVLVPLVQAEVALAARRLPDLLAGILAQVTPWLEERFGVHLAFDLDTIRDFIAENAQSAQELSLKLLSGVRAGGRIVLALLVNVALIPVVMFYLLRDWPLLLARIDELLPLRWRPKIRQMTDEIDSVLAEFLRGQLMVMVVLAVYYAIALSVVGLDRAVAIGVLTGLLVFIPYVGFGLGLILGVLAALLQWSGWPAFLAVLAVYGAGQLLENYVLVPYLVGDRIGLHPLAVIFALLAFGQLFGFAGVLLALPASAAILVGLRHLRAAYVASRSIATADPGLRVPEQLTFELAPPESPTFDNFLPEGNEELVDVLRRAARGAVAETGIVVWGVAGAGKSHLLQAVVDAAARAGHYARYLRSPELAPAQPPELGALLAVDEVERASAEAQAHLFTLYNALAGTAGQLVVAAAAPPARLGVRPDLRTRLGHGLVYEIVPVRDEAKPAALARYAAARGFTLDRAVIDYVLAHDRRDMASLLRTLAALDRHSLAQKRPITVPLVRELLAKPGKL